MPKAFDVIVLGAGSAGLATAFRAAHHGARVALFEPDLLGGTCIHRGCVPKKAMWFAAQLARQQVLAVAYGFALEHAPLQWGKFFDQRQRYVDGITGRYRERLEKAGIERIERKARLVAANAVVDDSGERWQAAHIVIATGARPRRVDMPGFELGLLSDDMFELRELPGRIAVVGGGYVGVEFAGMLQALGCQVHLFADEHMLASFDAELVDALAELMKAQGIGITGSVRVTAARKHADGISLDGNDLALEGRFDSVLWALGRVPNTERLGLDELRVATDKAGHVLVDNGQNTTVRGVYAVGDACQHKPLTPVAVAAGRRLADRLFGDMPDSRMDYENIPSAVFAEPPLAAVGLTEVQARERHGSTVSVHRSSFTPMQWGVVNRTERSVMKVVCVGEDERVVGVHLLGAGAEEMLQGFAVAVRLGVCKRDLDAAVPIHPTSAEELLLLP